MERVYTIAGHVLGGTISASIDQRTSVACLGVAAQEADEPNVVIVERPREAIALVTLNRPKALNAFNRQLAYKLKEVLNELDADPTIRCIVVTGNKRAFAAGADISQMADAGVLDIKAKGNHIDVLGSLTDGISKPIVAAVSGWALGGGCEFAMMCDIVVASESAKFGQPEIKLGTIPGAGGTQRLVYAIGKSKAMELVLTGDSITAEQAKQMGLVSHVVSDDALIEFSLQLAQKIASMSAPVVALAKEAVNKSFETSLAEGLLLERRLFQTSFAFADKREGMRAFQEKRPAAFQHQ